jgi:hypothetical protein
MNLEEHTRTNLDHLTADVVGGPDLATAIRNGRRRRRSRVTVLAVSGLAVAAVAGGITAHQLQQPTTTVEVTPATQPATYQDFVPGTDIDEAMQATVAAHLTGAPDATKVYPSDWNRNSALPDAQFANATDWEAHYTLGTDETLTVSMFKKIPGYPAGTACRDNMDNPGLPCTVTTEADGSVLLHYGFTIGDNYRISTLRVAPDGSVVQAFDDLQAASWAAAEQASRVLPAQLVDLVDDPAMTFPAPVVTPPAPDGP